MREIKFRAWDNECKVIREYDELKGLTLDALDASDFKLEQFTGMRDINGKPIYEGDLVQNMNHSDKWGVVEYHETGFLIRSCGDTFGKYFLLTRSCNKLGNIHENQELFEAD